ncbi:MAG: 5-(carboxyamino)imidazole ribonucleotide mutase, partial [Spirochaetes bacterium GWF1_41_5]
LEFFNIACSIRIASAHRTPEHAIALLNDDSAECIIAAAGLAAHLPGVLAAHTIKPVIGLPVPSGSLNGIDALLSIVQMPPGIPVAAVAIGEPGAKNAAILAAEILSLKYPALKDLLVKFRQMQKEKIIAADSRINSLPGK